MFMLLLAVLPVLLSVDVTIAKLYDKCELANDLEYVYDFPKEQISTWVCIVQHESHFNTSAMNHGTGDHGLFQISQLYWCSPDSVGYACNANCASFRDDDISDDIKCVKKIFKEHSKLSGNGFNAWTIYGYYCRGNTSRYVEACPGNDIDKTQIAIAEEIQELDEDGYSFPPLPIVSKIYNRCELARELQEVHKIPMDELPTWVCIAQHESSFNTSSNNLGSGDHGLFQISEHYWCSTVRKGGGCNARCSQFRDTNITDDVSCVRTIFNEHKTISGNGFDAWSIYPQYCKGDNSRYIGGCPGVDRALESKKQSKKLNIFRSQETKVYERCELAQELKYVHNIPDDQISKWVCIAQYESKLNTSALGRGDHGIFQISEQYWCSPYGKGSGCNANCNDFRDSDITDDIGCIQAIYNEHIGISGDGFNAWAVYPQFCKHDTTNYIRNCFIRDEGNTINTENQAAPAFDADSTKQTYDFPNVATSLQNHQNSLNTFPFKNEFTSFYKSSSASYLNNSTTGGSYVNYNQPNIPARSTINNIFTTSFPRITPTSFSTKISNFKDVSGQLRRKEDTRSDKFNFFFKRQDSPVLSSSSSPIKVYDYNSRNDLTNNNIDNRISSIPRARQMHNRPARPGKPKPRPPSSQVPSDTNTRRPAGPQRPSRPQGAPRPPGPPRPLGPPRPARPSIPTDAARPRPPPPLPSTVRPFSWNNLPGVIFTLWPSSTTGPVSTSVYSSNFRPIAGSGIVTTTSVTPTARYSSSKQPVSSSTTPYTLTSPKTVVRANRLVESSFASNVGVDRNTIKRGHTAHRDEFPGYAYFRTKLGFRLTQALADFLFMYFKGGPVMASFPHLLYGDKEYLNSVQGLEPNESKHQSFLILEPLSGLPLYGAQRIQLNIFLRPVGGMENLANISRALMPLVWLEEIVVTPDKYIKMLETDLFRTLNIIDIVKWSVIVFGVLCVTTAIFTLLYRQAP